MQEDKAGVDQRSETLQPEPAPRLTRGGSLVLLVLLLVLAGLRIPAAPELRAALPTLSSPSPALVAIVPDRPVLSSRASLVMAARQWLADGPTPPKGSFADTGIHGAAVFAVDDRPARNGAAPAATAGTPPQHVASDFEARAPPMPG